MVKLKHKHAQTYMLRATCWASFSVAVVGSCVALGRLQRGSGSVATGLFAWQWGILTWKLAVGGVAVGAWQRGTRSVAAWQWGRGSVAVGAWQWGRGSVAVRGVAAWQSGRGSGGVALTFHASPPWPGCLGHSTWFDELNFTRIEQHFTNYTHGIFEATAMVNSEKPPALKELLTTAKT